LKHRSMQKQMVTPNSNHHMWPSASALRRRARQQGEGSEGSGGAREAGWGGALIALRDRVGHSDGHLIPMRKGTTTHE
jgi:hypothetical protein